MKGAETLLLLYAAGAVGNQVGVAPDLRSGWIQAVYAVVRNYSRTPFHAAFASSLYSC